MTIWSVRSMSWWSSPLPLTALTPTLPKEPTSDQAPPRRAAGTRRLALRVRARRCQAGAPDQLVLPQPRRGDLRRVSAPDGGHRVEELPQDLARGARRRQAQLPVPHLAQGARNGQDPPRRNGWDLGVQGGRGRPARDEGGSLGPGGADARQPAVRGPRDLRG